MQGRCRVDVGASWSVLFVLDPAHSRSLMTSANPIFSWQAGRGPQPPGSWRGLAAPAGGAASVPLRRTSVPGRRGSGGFLPHGLAPLQKPGGALSACPGVCEQEGAPGPGPSSGSFPGASETGGFLADSLAACHSLSAAHPPVHPLATSGSMGWFPLWAPQVPKGLATT